MNCASLRGSGRPLALLSMPSPPPSPTSQGQGEAEQALPGTQCGVQEGVKDGRRWWSHRLPEGGWCKGRK